MYLKDENYSIILNSEYFDSEWYSSHYDFDCFDPAYHYLHIGFKKGYNPGPDFSSLEYYLCNPDAENKGINPLLHYELYGRDENRQIHIKKDSQIISLENEIYSNNCKILNLKQENKKLNDNLMFMILFSNKRIKKLKIKNRKLKSRNRNLKSLNDEISRNKSSIFKIRNFFKNLSKSDDDEPIKKDVSKKSNKILNNITGILPLKKLYLSLYNFPYSYETYIINEDLNRLNLFFDKIDGSIYEFSELFSFIINYCNENDYSLRIIYSFADFNKFNTFLDEKKLKLPDDVSFLNLKHNNYLEIGFNEKNVCTSWKCARSLINTPAVNSVIYFYPGYLNQCTKEEFFQISNICYSDNVVILNDNPDKLKYLRNFKFKYELSTENDFSGENKTLCCDFGDFFIEGIKSLNYLVFNNIIDIESWKIYIIFRNDISKFYYNKFRFNEHVTFIYEKLEGCDLYLTADYKPCCDGENYISLFAEDFRDDNYKVLNIKDVNYINDFKVNSNLKASKPLWPVKEIFDKINEGI